jgi:hypothetical protein
MKGTLMSDNTWRISTASDDILNFIIYIGCVYGLIDREKYNGREPLWPDKSLYADIGSDTWESWFKEIVDLEVERIKSGKNPCTSLEVVTPPEFCSIKNQSLQSCCIKAWPRFKEWWYMLGGGKNALNFTEGIIHDDLHKYVKDAERLKGRYLKPFNIYLSLLYTGLSESIEININNNQFFIITSNPFEFLKEDWWIKKLNEIG